ncbi:threonine synthase [bacterium]|nr:threonine synthase [candidate division CSSED10-310 bacterium]
MDQIMYYSTNGKAPDVTLAEALLTGQAPDKGLYMPRTIPQVTDGELASLKGKTYPEIAEFILSKYVLDTFSREVLRDLCVDAYDYDVPLENVFERTYIMRLDRGPTASFKDFAARMMGRMIGALMRGQKRELVILTATSGDTGSAIAHAFYQIPNIQVMVLFPPAEVSNRQRKQMTTLGDNVSTVGVSGKFDDCQALVKQAFADPELSSIRLTSANSINIGRLLPQIVYYFYAYSKLANPGEEIIFSVPSGNFGDMMGSLLAKRMGLPIRKIIIATNANDEVPNYMGTGVYSKIVPSRVCISNAMNVGHPSNFARVIDMYGGWMDESGKIHRQPDMISMRSDMFSVSINDQQTRMTIKDAWESNRLLLEPHGAVGWAGLKRYIEESGDSGLMVSVETAHPAKFPEEIEALLNIVPDIPPSLMGLEEKTEEYFEMPVDYNTFRSILKERYEP